MKYSKDAFGSTIEITIYDEYKNDSVITESFLLIDRFEQEYSRFIKGNILSEINSGKKILLDSALYSLISFCLQVSKMTQGYYDISVLPLLENSGYGIQSADIEYTGTYKDIFLEEGFIELYNGAQIEFGSCAKGYMVDNLYSILAKEYKNFVVNFGGDMRVAGSQNIFLEDPLDRRKNIGSLNLENMSIASSSGNRRKIGDDKHHLINPKSGESSSKMLAIYVSHRLASFADIFATALFVSPITLAIEVLEETPGLEALIIGSDGKIFKSQGFKATLTI